MLTTCPALWVQPPGRWQPSSWSLATQCDLTTSAAAPGQQVWGKGSAVHLLHHQAREPSLCCTVTLFCLAAGK